MWHCYLRRGVVYLPTVALIDNGFYLDIEPVAVVSTSNTEALRRALHDVIARGNPPVPSMTREQRRDPLLPKYAGLKTWATFARDASLWSINEEAGIFQIIGYRDADTGGWEQDKDNIKSFPPNATDDQVIERMIAILQASAQQAQSS
jgi:hypothetical protein